MRNAANQKDPVVVSFYCDKGGVGKTTLVHNLAYLFATEAGLKVLAVDADPQCNLSNQLLKTPDPREISDQRLKTEYKDREKLVSDYYDKEQREKNRASSDEQLEIYDCFEPS